MLERDELIDRGFESYEIKRAVWQQEAPDIPIPVTVGAYSVFHAVLSRIESEWEWVSSDQDANTIEQVAHVLGTRFDNPFHALYALRYSMAMQLFKTGQSLESAYSSLYRDIRRLHPDFLITDDWYQLLDLYSTYSADFTEHDFYIISDYIYSQNMYVSQQDMEQYSLFFNDQKKAERGWKKLEPVLKRRERWYARVRDALREELFLHFGHMEALADTPEFIGKDQRSNILWAQSPISQVRSVRSQIEHAVMSAWKRKYSSKI